MTCNLVAESLCPRAAAVRSLLRPAGSLRLQHASTSVGGFPVRTDTTTAADGSFALDGLPPGAYWLDVKAHGFQERRLRYELGRAAADPIRIVLGLAPFASEITVTAERGTIADVDRAAPVVSVRTATDFRQRP